MAQATAGIRDHAGWQIAAAAFCGQTLASLGFLSVPLFAPSLAALNGLDERDFGFSGSFCFLAVALASPAAGHLVRRCGAVPMMTGALVMMATSFLLILFGTWTATMAASFGFGLAYGVYGAGRRRWWRRARRWHGAGSTWRCASPACPSRASLQAASCRR